MALKDAVVNLILKAQNAISPAIDDAASSLYDAQKRADDLVNELNKLDKQAQQLRDFDTLTSQTEDLARAMRDAQNNAARLQAELKNTKNPSASLRAEFTNAKTAASLATSEYKRQQTELSRLSSSLSKGGIDTKNLGTAETTLKQRIADTSAKAKQAALDMGTYAAAQKKTKTSSEGLSGALGKLKTLLLFGAGAQALRGLISVTDQYKQLEGQLRQVVDGQDDLNTTFGELHELSNDTRAPLEATVNLYARMDRSTKNLKLSQDQLLTLTRAVNQSFVVAGASTTEATSATLQFGQALASGKLAGDELKSIMENSPRLSRAMAEGLGVTIGQLRAMGANGELTAERITQALLKTADTIDADFKKVPETVGQALTKLHNDVVAAFGSKDATAPLTEGINEFRKAATDPALVEGLTSIGRTILQIGAWAAQGFSAVSGFMKYIGESTAAFFNGPAADDIPRLEDKVKRLQTALSGPWYQKDIRDVFKSHDEVMKELVQTQGLLTGALGTSQQAQQKNTESVRDAATEAKAKAAADQAATSILNDMTAAQGKAAEAAKALGIDMNAAIDGISENAQKLLNSYNQLSTSVRDMGATTEQQAVLMAQAFDKVLAAADNKAALEALKTSLQATFDAGTISAAQYKDEIGQIDAKIQKLSDSTAITSQKIQGELGDAFKSLGIDIHQALTGVDQESQNLLDNYQKVADKLVGLGLTAEQQGRVMQQAFAKAFASADSIQELESLKNAIRQAFNQGEISATDYSNELSQLDSKMQKLKSSGVDMGNAQAGVQDNVVQPALERSIDKADELSSRTRQLAQDADNLSQSYSRMYSMYEVAENQFRDAGMGDAADALSKYRQSLFKQYSVAGGVPAFVMDTINKQLEAKRIQLGGDPNGGVRQQQSSVASTSSQTEPAQKSIQQQLLESVLGQRAAAQPTPAAQNVNVNIKMPNGTTSTVGVASSADADTLVKALEDIASRTY